MEKLKYEDITGKIIGAAFEVHKFLGNGFQACLPKGNTAYRQEVIYQRALAYEMKMVGLAFAREIEHPIYYKELKEEIGMRRADFVVSDWSCKNRTLSV